LDGKIEGNSNFCEIRKLEVDTFYVIVDCLVTELDKRLSAYDNLCSIFGFITKFGSQLLSETSADIFISTFKDDIDTINIKQEIVHFSSYIMQLNLPIISPQHIYLYVHENNFKKVFPNVYDFI